MDLEAFPPPSYYDPPEDTILPSYSSTDPTFAVQCGLELADSFVPPPGTGQYQFQSDHMKIDLGPRLWDLKFPTYGLNGVVEGSIKLTGDRNHVERVTVTLEGEITTTTTQRGAICGQSKESILSRTITLHTSYLGNPLPWDQDYTFSIPIPDRVNTKGKASALPPSFIAHHPGVSSKVLYTVKFDMVRKGIRRHESITIPIHYLPRTRPMQPPLMEIPPQSWNSDMPFPVDGVVRTVKLSAIWPEGRSQLKGGHSEKAIYLSLPSSHCFASGGSIPFMLSILWPESPAIVKLIAPQIRISLVKRVRIFRGVNGEVSSRESMIGSAELQQGHETAEGAHLLKGSIRTGKPGQESSWKIEDLADVQYLIRACLQPPAIISEHLPEFRHEELVQITTDRWDTLERELHATGGIPNPAFGLRTSPRRILSRY